MTAGTDWAFLVSLFHLRPRPKFVIEPKNGLGNRLSALASAAVIAEQTGRNLIILWLQNMHFQANLQDFYDVSRLIITNTSSTNLLNRKNQAPVASVPTSSD